jgi:hypothetical protein
MAKLDTYRTHIENLLKEYSSYQPSYGDIKVHTIFDREQGHYQLLNVGWHGHKRIFGCVLHLDIIEGKIWIQHDGTDIGIADELVALGIPKEDIVLAFHAPSMRKYTEFAVS